MIPQSIKKDPKVKPKTKFLIFGKDDTVIMKKLEFPDIKKGWNQIFKSKGRENLKISEEEIQKEVAEARKNSDDQDPESRP